MVGSAVRRRRPVPGVASPAPGLWFVVPLDDVVALEADRRHDEVACGEAGAGRPDAPGVTTAHPGRRGRRWR
jgi:hypothetical protein